MLYTRISEEEMNAMKEYLNELLNKSEDTEKKQFGELNKNGCAGSSAVRD